MPIHRSGRYNVSGVRIVPLGNVLVEEPQCNLTDLTTSWERQNKVYVHFKNVTGAQRPRSLNTAKVKKEQTRPHRSGFLKLLGIF